MAEQPAMGLLGASLNKAVLPLVSELSGQEKKVDIVTYVPINNHQEKRKASIYYVDRSHHELLLRCVIEFLDACQLSRLAITTGPEKFNKFRECLGGSMRDSWDVQATGLAHTIVNFVAVLQAFILLFFDSTAQADQTRYLNRTTKPTSLNCLQLAERLRFINRLMAWFPGREGVVPFSDADLKILFYTMMPTKWRIQFIESNRDINDPQCTLTTIQRHMTLYEQAEIAHRSLQARVPRRRPPYRYAPAPAHPAYAYGRCFPLIAHQPYQPYPVQRPVQRPIQGPSPSPMPAPQQQSFSVPRSPYRPNFRGNYRGGFRGSYRGGFRNDFRGGRGNFARGRHPGRGGRGAPQDAHAFAGHVIPYNRMQPRPYYPPQDVQFSDSYDNQCDDFDSYMQYDDSYDSFLYSEDQTET